MAGLPYHSMALNQSSATTGQNSNFRFMYLIVYSSCTLVLETAIGLRGNRKYLTGPESDLAKGFGNILHSVKSYSTVLPVADLSVQNCSSLGLSQSHLKRTPIVGLLLQPTHCKLPILIFPSDSKGWNKDDGSPGYVKWGTQKKRNDF